MYGYVPDSFGTSFFVPVPKNDINKLFVFEGYRPVSLINVISKVFEILLNVLVRLIVTDDLQFGFISGKKCHKALLVVSTVLNCFNEKGSNVYIAKLHVAKAFDNVNLYGIFINLINVNIPLSFEYSYKLVL